jgi:hypothetical protein
LLAERDKGVGEMKRMPVSGLALFFDTKEQEAAELVRQACEKSVRLIHQLWGLDTPKDCRVYVMTSWPRFMFHSAPWRWWILLGLTMPLWYSQVSQKWRMAGGWAQRYGQRWTVGIKPPRLIQTGDSRMGDLIFCKENDAAEKIQHITCHELVHAFTDHLKLPAWLHEGLALVTVDEFFEKPTIRPETLETLRRLSGIILPGNYNKLNLHDQDAVVYLYVRGYWITRYIEETHPELLKSLFAQRYPHRVLEDKIAAACGMSHDQFWKEIDNILVSHKWQELPSEAML